MRYHARFSLLALLAGAIVFVSAPAAQAAFGIQRFFASNCKETAETCGSVTNPTLKESEEQGFTQAGGHPNFGITDFTVNTSGGKPEGVVKHIRTDVAPGVSTNPEVVKQCSFEEFGNESLPKSGLFDEPKCGGETKIGVNKVKVFVEGLGAIGLEGPVYNLVQPQGLTSDFGVAIGLPKPITEAELFKIFKGSQPAIEKKQYWAHTLIEGHVEWASDYHDYFEINVSPSLPLISSRLTFTGNIGQGKAPVGSGGFLTNPTSCTGTGPQTTSTLTLEPVEGKPVQETYTTLVGNTGCNLLPFKPTFELTPETTQSDQPDGIIAELGMPHDLEPGEGHLDSSQVKTANVTLPEGMTLNPSAAAGLTACTPAQARITSKEKGVLCPESSKVGTVNLEVPGLPPGSLAGNLYLGGPETGPITGPPYVMYVDAESERYGVSVRLRGTATPNETTGRITASFTENPEQPFSKLILHLKGGALAPIANPLACGTATSESVLTPFSGTAPFSPLTPPFVVDSNNAKGACASPLPFSLSQSTQNQSPNAGSHTSFTFNLARADGQQYLSQVKTTLPPGLAGQVPAVKLCEEPQAAAGTCSGESQIGTATVQAGAGPTPYSFSGPVYMTGPYNGAPFGMSIAVPAVAGPFNLGTVVTRATINIDPYTDRVTVASVLPTIVKGVPLRVKAISVAVNKQGFLLNPTNCNAFATESTLTGFTPGSSASATQSLSSPFQVGNCNALAFKPSFKSVAGARTSKANGASLETTINQGSGQANIKSVLVQLPRQLPSRLTTLQKACPAATFASNPYHCPAGSFVGGARANTPLLPAKLKGPAILVSHAAAAFPDLDLVLEGNGVRTILVGNTDIKHSITTTNFAATPDVPVTSITVNLPTGPHSALTAIGNLCALSSFVMPTTITGWNGKQIRQKTKIAVAGCPVRIVGHKVIGNTAYLTVQTHEAGRISGSGAQLSTVYRHLRSAKNATTLKVSLARGARRPLQTRIRVGFLPSKRGAPSSAAFVRVRFG